MRRYGKRFTATPAVRLPISLQQGPGTSGHRAAIAEGAQMAYADSYLPTFGGTRDPDRDAVFGFHTITLPRFRMPWEVYVNRSGNRFMAEDEPSPDKRERFLYAQEDETFWCVYDQAIADAAPPLFTWCQEKTTRAFAEHPDFQTADSLHTLATQCEMDAKALESVSKVMRLGPICGRGA